MNVPAGEFLYLGDTGIDMQTAIQAGMFPVGALWGFRPREELLQHGAAVLVERPEALLKVVEELVTGALGVSGIREALLLTRFRCRLVA